MAVLTLIHNGRTRQIPFAPPQSLESLLEEQGIRTLHPCGGRGVCGKCAVTLTGAVSEPNDVEREAGCRLVCQAVLLGDAAASLADHDLNQIEIGSAANAAPAPMAEKLGAAVDLGTTTMALRLCRPDTGQTIGVAACPNPQGAVAADVIGRIEAALAGKQEILRRMALDAMARLLADACAQAGVSAGEVDTLVITGNTTMLYLLTGRSPISLSHAPFEADCLFGFETKLLSRRAYLPPCMNAFVGADITCAVLASRMTEQAAPALLCDIGTNGELALWKDGTLYVTSTAAGPAFEGAGISRGCGSIRGAIDRVWLENGSIRCHTIGNAPAVGLCGSGLIDAVAAFLELGLIDETGAAEEDSLRLTETVALLPKDIRAVQLAKAAIAAGIRTLLEHTGTVEADLAHFYICGGFGTHLNLDSATAIGLIPAALAGRAVVLGNAALTGAVTLLHDREAIRQTQALAAAARHIELGGNPRFNDNFVDQMFFPAEEP